MPKRADIRLWVDDGTGTFYPALNLQDAQYVQTLGYVGVANPSEYGAEYGEAGMLHFELSCSYVRAADGLDMQPNAVHQQLRSVLQNRGSVEVALELPGGEWRRGEVYVTGLDLNTRLGQPVPESVTMEGTSAMGSAVPPIPPTSGDDSGGTGGDGDTGDGDTGGGTGGGTITAETLTVLTAYETSVLEVYDRDTGTLHQTFLDADWPRPVSNLHDVKPDPTDGSVIVRDGEGLVRYNPLYGVDATATITFTYTGTGFDLFDIDPPNSRFWVHNTDGLTNYVKTFPYTGGGETVQFTYATEDFSSYTDIVWVPTGPYLIVVGLPNVGTNGVRIVRFDPDGANPTVLHESSHSNYPNDAVFDPITGDVFVATDDPTEGILRVDPTGTTPPYSIGKGGYAIAVDQDFVYYGSSISGESGIWKMTRDGGSPTQFVDTGYFYFAVSGPEATGPVSYTGILISDTSDTTPAIRTVSDQDGQVKQTKTGFGLAQDINFFQNGFQNGNVWFMDFVGGEVVSYDQTANTYDTYTLTSGATLDPQGFAVAPSLDRAFEVPSNSLFVRQWELSTGTALGTFDISGFCDVFLNMCYSPNGHLYIYGWDPTRTNVRFHRVNTDGSGLVILNQNNGGLQNAFKFCPATNELFAVGRDFVKLPMGLSSMNIIAAFSSVGDFAVDPAGSDARIVYDKSDGNLYHADLNGGNETLVGPYPSPANYGYIGWGKPVT